MNFIAAVQSVVDRLWHAAHPAPGIRAENELRTMSIDDLAEAMREALGGASSTGLAVTPERALRTAAYWTAVKVLDETVAQIPLNVMRPTDNGRGTEIAKDAPLQALLSKRGRPNDWQTSFTFKRLMVWQISNRGNFYAFKNIVDGELRELLPIVPTHRVRVDQDDDFRLIYRVHMRRGGARDFTRREIFHVMGESDDGFQGLNPMRFMGEAIGLAIAQDTHAGKLFANGARLWGVLEHPETLSDTAAVRLEASFNDVYAGPENAHKTAILEEGMKFNPVSQNAEEAQLLESRKLQRSIVAGGMRVPEHMVGNLDKATFSNIENLARQFIDFAIVPWLENIETACDQQLLTQAERAAGLRCKFNPTALLRGSAKDRSDFYAKMVAMRAMNPNEVREREDMNPYDEGDAFINPNIDTGEGGDPPPEDRDDEPRARLSVVESGGPP